MNEPRIDLKIISLSLVSSILINFSVLMVVPYFTYLRPVKVNKIYSIDLLRLPRIQKQQKKEKIIKKKPVPKLPEDTENINKNAKAPPVQEEGVYELDDLDEIPRIIRMEKPKYPEELRLSGIEGRVVLKFMISYFGYVENISVIEPSVHPRFDEVSIETVKKWQFSPPKVKGRPASVWFIVPIRFTLEK